MLLFFFKWRVVESYVFKNLYICRQGVRVFRICTFTVVVYLNIQLKLFYLYHQGDDLIIFMASKEKTKMSLFHNNSFIAVWH